MTPTLREPIKFFEALKGLIEAIFLFVAIPVIGGIVKWNFTFDLGLWNIWERGLYIAFAFYWSIVYIRWQKGLSKIKNK